MGSNKYPLDIQLNCTERNKTRQKRAGSWALVIKTDAAVRHRPSAKSAMAGTRRGRCRPA